MSKKLIETIKNDLNTYGKSHQHIAKFIINNADSVPNMTISALAKSAYCSPSSVSRFINKLGYDSYFEFCHVLKSSDATDHPHTALLNSFHVIHNNINDNIETIANKLNEYNNIFIMSSIDSKTIQDFSINISNLLDTSVYYSSDINNNIKIVSLIGENDLCIYVHNSERLDITVNLDNTVNLLLISYYQDLSRSVYQDTSLDFSSLFNQYKHLNKYFKLYIFDIIFENFLKKNSK
ncbi:hypothetical protein RZE82_04310 [Mollicutes bacterium LVI A0039]|nr:hypothetical protein RZE82_04310 [Mollicutes bacterium LVI A0039]